MDFKIGQRVVLTEDYRASPTSTAARPGATATVRGYKEYGSTRFVDLVWDRENGLAGTQMNGGYRPEDFVADTNSRFIVIRVNGKGTWEPATNPHVHYSRESAEKEAQRLAGKVVGYTFRVLQMGTAYKGVTTVQEVA